MLKYVIIQGRFNEDLMKERFHPRNLRKFSSWGHSGGIDEDDE